MGEKTPVVGQKARRIVLSGGPGGGKTTALDLFRREMAGRVVVAPEAATMLFAGGFPRTPEARARRAAQAAIFHVQRGTEDSREAACPGAILLCDRGTIDGAAYWPDDDGDFFTAMGTTHDAELARYDAVLFFETAAAGGHSVASDNPARIESQGEAIEIDARLRALWSKHPRFVLIKNESSFFAKVTNGFHALSHMVDHLNGKNEAKGKAT